MAAHQVMVEAKVIRSYAAETGQVTLASSRMEGYLHSGFQHEVA